MEVQIPPPQGTGNGPPPGGRGSAPRIVGESAETNFFLAYRDIFHGIQFCFNHGERAATSDSS